MPVIPKGVRPAPPQRKNNTYCMACGKTFPAYIALKAHKKQGCPMTINKCDLCVRFFPGGFKDHYMVCSGMRYPRSRKPDSFHFGENYYFECDKPVQPYRSHSQQDNTGASNAPNNQKTQYAAIIFVEPPKRLKNNKKPKKKSPKVSKKNFFFSVSEYDDMKV